MSSEEPILGLEETKGGGEEGDDAEAGMEVKEKVSEEVTEGSGHVQEESEIQPTSQSPNEKEETSPSGYLNGKGDKPNSTSEDVLRQPIMTERDPINHALPDYLKPGLDIVFIGINPGFIAAETGKWYAGPGNHFWKLLYMSGLVTDQLSSDNDFELPNYGIGLTNVVERTTKGSNDLSVEEMKEGSGILMKKLELIKPKIAVFNGKEIYKIFSGKKKFDFGKQAEPLEGLDTVVYVMPSSSARCAQLPRAVDKLPYFEGLRKLRDYISGNLAELHDSEVTFPGALKSPTKRPNEDSRDSTDALNPGTGLDDSSRNGSDSAESAAPNSLPLAPPAKRTLDMADVALEGEESVTAVPDGSQEALSENLPPPEPLAGDSHVAAVPAESQPPFPGELSTTESTALEPAMPSAVSNPTGQDLAVQPPAVLTAPAPGPSNEVQGQQMSSGSSGIPSQADQQALNPAVSNPEESGYSEGQPQGQSGAYPFQSQLPQSHNPLMHPQMGGVDPELISRHIQESVAAVVQRCKDGTLEFPEHYIRPSEPAPAPRVMTQPQAVPSLQHSPQADQQPLHHQQQPPQQQQVQQPQQLQQQAKGMAATNQLLAGLAAGQYQSTTAGASGVSNLAAHAFDNLMSPYLQNQQQQMYNPLQQAIHQAGSYQVSGGNSAGGQWPGANFYDYLRQGQQSSPQQQQQQTQQQPQQQAGQAQFRPQQDLYSQYFAGAGGMMYGQQQQGQGQQGQQQQQQSSGQQPNF